MLQPTLALASPDTPAAAAALEVEIDRCASREHVARLAVHLARAYADCAAICAVRPDRIEVVAAEGFGGHVGALFVPTGVDSLFSRVVETGEAFRGVPPVGGFDERVLAALGRSHAQEIAILPVTLRGRVVNLLYADSGAEVLGDAATAALGTVCTRIARAYTRLILERKARATREPAGVGASLLRA